MVWRHLLRLVLGGLTPSTVSLQGASGTTANKNPYLNLSEIALGSSSSVITLVILGGGSTNFSFTPRVKQEQAEEVALGVDIIQPKPLLTVGSTPLQVSGAITDPNATLTINGLAVSHANGLFSAAVSVEEGHNTIIARAVNTTDSIVISLNTTPSYITVDSPLVGEKVASNSIAVGGLIYDIVRGTVSETQANVKVNGIQAKVSNRSYLAEDVSLIECVNEVIISAAELIRFIKAWEFKRPRLSRLLFRVFLKITK